MTDVTPRSETVSPASIEEAATALTPYLRPTPLEYSRAFTAKTGCHVHMKIEGAQPIRAFKVRGALNKILSLAAEDRAAGVLTASAGNHGQGVAYGAHVFNVPATVYVPDGANPLKVEAMKRLGARVIHFGRNYNDAYTEAMRFKAETHATFIPAFDDADVIAGQGTIAVEILHDLPYFDTILVPVGGGGLISGISIYLKARRPKTRVIGVEPAGADSLYRSLRAGHPVKLQSVRTIADGLAASAPGELPFEIASRCVDEVILVEESEMLRAIKLYFEWEHLLAEPAGAAALAALLYHYRPVPNEVVVVVLSGANVTDDLLIRALRER